MGVPSTRHKLVDLRDAFAEVLRSRPRRRGDLLVEITLIDGVNDGVEHADELVELIKPLPGYTRVNVIPYNENEGLGAAGKLFRPSTPDRIFAYQQRVVASGILCTKRMARADSEASACG